MPQRFHVVQDLADEQRLEHLVDAHLERAHASGQGMEVTGADYPGARLHLYHQQIDVLQAEETGLGGIGEGNGQQVGTDVGNLHPRSSLALSLLRSTAPARSRSSRQT